MAITKEEIITKYVGPEPESEPGSTTWIAFPNGFKEHGVYGYGHTEQEAIDDLIDLLSIF